MGFIGFEEGQLSKTRTLDSALGLRSCAADIFASIKREEEESYGRSNKEGGLVVSVRLS